MQYPVAPVGGAVWDACSQKSLGLALIIIIITKVV